MQFSKSGRFGAGSSLDGALAYSSSASELRGRLGGWGVGADVEVVAQCLVKCAVRCGVLESLVDQVLLKAIDRAGVAEGIGWARVEGSARATQHHVLEPGIGHRLSLARSLLHQHLHHAPQVGSSGVSATFDASALPHLAHDPVYARPPHAESVQKTEWGVWPLTASGPPSEEEPAATAHLGALVGAHCKAQGLYVPGAINHGTVSHGTVSHGAMGHGLTSNSSNPNMNKATNTNTNPFAGPPNPGVRVASTQGGGDHSKCLSTLVQDAVWRVWGPGERGGEGVGGTSAHLPVGFGWGLVGGMVGVAEGVGAARESGELNEAGAPREPRVPNADAGGVARRDGGEEWSMSLQFARPSSALLPLLVCCSVVQCVAVCCSVMQRVAVSCRVLQSVASVAVCCSLVVSSSAASGVLQCVAVCCSVLQCVARPSSAPLPLLVCCSVLQSVAVCCSLLQSVAVYCSLLQSCVACCSLLQSVAVCCSSSVCFLVFWLSLSRSLLLSRVLSHSLSLSLSLSWLFSMSFCVSLTHIRICTCTGHILVTKNHIHTCTHMHACTCTPTHPHI